MVILTLPHIFPRLNEIDFSDLGWGMGSLHVFKYVFHLSVILTHSSVSSITTGQTIRGGQTFEDFCGPLLGVIQDKYCEWLNLSYSMCLSFLVPNTL